MAASCFAIWVSSFSGRAASGFVIGGGLGLIFGLIAGLSRLGEALFDTTLQMLRKHPAAGDFAAGSCGLQ